MMIDSDRDDPRKKTEPDIPLRDYVDGDDIRFINWKAHRKVGVGKGVELFFIVIKAGEIISEA